MSCHDVMSSYSMLLTQAVSCLWAPDGTLHVLLAGGHRGVLRPVRGGGEPGQGLVLLRSPSVIVSPLHNITQAFYDDEVNCLVTSFIFGCETEHKTCKYETNISPLLSLMSHKTVEDCTTVCNEKPGSHSHRVYNMMLTLLWTLV